MKKLFTCIACVFILALTGCQNAVNTVENSEKTMTPNVIRDSRFVADGFLKDRLALKNLTVSRTEAGFMRVQLEVVNIRTGAFSQMWSSITKDNPYQIQYKFTWFTKDGMAFDTILSNWQNHTIIPGETAHLQSVAPTKNCHDFKISLKEANYL